jgi:hypothetical protein
MVSMICQLMIGDRPMVGSSNMSSLGLAIMALPIATICCSPPENSLRPSGHSGSMARAPCSAEPT